MLEELLEGLPYKFAAIVVDASDRARIMREPEIEKFSAIRRSFILQTTCIAEAGKGVDAR